MKASVVIPTYNGRERLARALASLRPAGPYELIVVDNASTDGTAALVRERFPEVVVVDLPENRGFGRAINAGVERSSGDVLVFVNNDCVCDPEFVPLLAGAIDAGSGVVMAAGVMRQGADPSLIDNAGICVDSTLLVYDYLSGQPVTVLDGPVEPPLGPCGAAAAYDRAAFLEAGGFDEALFAYWEDVDLALAIRAAGGTCALQPTARGTHEHAATLGLGSARKNYLMGFGRAYVLRKWGGLSLRRAPSIAVRELAICAGQAFFDRNVQGIVGRIDGVRAGRSAAAHEFPVAAMAGRAASLGVGAIVADRLRRRLRVSRASR